MNEATKPKRKEIKIPGPDHPISIFPANGRIRIVVANQVIAESTRVLVLEEKGYPSVYYIPREDARMDALVSTTHYSYCPYKGDCSYFSIPAGGSRSEYAAWSYENPYEAVAPIRCHLAFYPTRVDAIEFQADSNASEAKPD
jgi:uncharacterized protein (DUF427 family)